MPLPQMRYRDNIKKTVRETFGGLDLRESAGDGSFAAMLNMSSRHYPLLSPRERRGRVGALSAPGGVFADGELYTVKSGSLFRGSRAVCAVTEGQKTLAALGRFIVIFPDKKYYDTVGDVSGTLEQHYAPGAGRLTFCDGLYAGEPAKACCVVTDGEPFPFRAGDAVTFAGATREKNNLTAVVREIGLGGRRLTFYENTFDLGGATAYTEPAAVTVSRTVPELDFVCQNENRLWGCKGDTIYASKLGDPFNWNCFEGLADDSWAVESGSAGDFTGCISYLGYPVFFKEDRIYKVHGAKPSAFQLMASAVAGVKRGCGRSLAVAGETLLYLSPSGVMAYGGGVPSPVSACLGEGFSDGVAGSDGRKYYISMRRGETCGLFVYDTERGLWHREDNSEAIGFAYLDGLYMLLRDGELLKLTGDMSGLARENAVPSAAETGDIYESLPDKKGLTRLQVRVRLEAGAALTAYLSCDGGAWENVGTLYGGSARSAELPIVPRRCDRWRLRLEGSGEWRLLALSREYYAGSSR